MLSLDITRNNNIYINFKSTHNTIRNTLTFRNILIYLMAYILLLIKLINTKTHYFANNNLEIVIVCCPNYLTNQ